MAGRGRPFVVVWDEADTEEALRTAYRAERDVDVRQRLHALWLLRSGERCMDAPLCPNRPDALPGCQSPGAATRSTRVQACR